MKCLTLDSIPQVQQLAPLIAAIAEDVGGEHLTGRTGKVRSADILINDDRLGKLEERWETYGIGLKGQVFIACPFKHGHSGDSGISECAYFPAGTGGYQQGHYVCLHASCTARSDREFDDAIGIGGAEDFLDLLNSITDTSSLPLKVELFGEIKPQLSSRFLIKGLLPANSKIVIIGQPGCGKSFFAIDAALHIAAGREWFGRKVTAGGVVYVAAEGQAGVRLRIDAWKKFYGLENAEIPFALVPTPVDLLNPGGDLTNLSVVLQYLANLWNGIDLVVIDTLAQTFGGGDENGADMAAYVANVARLADPHQCATAIVHHQPLDAQSKRPRGHGSLWGAADTLLHVEGSKDSVARRITVVKQKDHDPGSDILFKLNPVELGIDEDMEPVTSCVIERADYSEVPRVRGRKLSPKQQIALTALDRALEKGGITPPTEIPDHVHSKELFSRVVDVSSWRSEALSVLATPDIESDSARKTFNRVKDSLQAAGILGCWNNYVWRIE